MKIAIIGMGYVGLPLALRFAQAGVSVLGIDVDENKCTALNDGRSYIKHISTESVAAMRTAGLLEATSDFARVSAVEAILICVPTPLKAEREPDLSYVFGTGESIAPHLRSGQLVVLESTTYPGTTDTELRVILERGSGLLAGRDFHLAYSPEREDPGQYRPGRPSDSQDCRWPYSRLPRPGCGVLLARGRESHPGIILSRRRSDQVARKYFPLGEHRFG